MTNKIYYQICSIAAFLIASNGFTYAQQKSNEVKVVGQMKDVMWKGKLQGKIDLDTINNKKNLYAFGPVEYLAGEILVIDGKSYKSTVISETNMKVEETYDIKAPFLAFANISRWTEQKLPDSIQNIKQLEHYLNLQTRNDAWPFMFKLAGTVEEATIHIVNLPKGSTVSSPAEAHQGQVNYKLNNEESEIMGFFSTQHKTIFTHHDTFLHMHLITKDRKKMGHLDEVLFKKGKMKLFLPLD